MLLVVVNIYLFFSKQRYVPPVSKTIAKINTSKKHYYPLSTKIPKFTKAINYSKEELEEAVIGLQLPTWSRSYTKCDHPQSEVSCSQVISAWRCLSSWANHMNTTQFNDRKHFLMKHTYDGVGNRFSTDTTTFVIALMDNRSYIMESYYPSGHSKRIGQAFNFHPSVLIRDGEIDKFFKEKGDSIRSNIQTFDYWYRYDYFGTEFPHHQILYVDYLLYATMAYTHDQMSAFCREHFGMHAGYFICNFLMRLPQKAMDEAQKAFKNAPQNVRVFGVHLRFQFPGQFYSYNVTTTINTVLRFLYQKKNEMPTVFAFASDSGEMEKAFRTHFGDRMITTNTYRAADADHDSALYDIAMLEMCDECLLTYRSTFSFVVAMRMGKRAWFVERESPDVFHSSNSQSTAVSALFHNWDVNDWQLNRRVHVLSKNEEALRYYFRYFLL